MRPGSRPYRLPFSVARAALPAFAILAGWAVSAAAGAELPFALQLRLEEARTHLAQARWSEAAVTLRGLLQEAPGHTPAVIELVRALTNAGRREEALAALHQAAAVERDPGRSALVRRGRVIARTFLTQETYQAYQEGLSQLQERKLGRAREVLRAALVREADHAEILLRLGQAALLDNDADSAAEGLRLARRLSPYEPEIRVWLGRAFHQRGEIAAALGELAAGQALLPESEYAAIWLAEALMAANQRAAAIQTLEAQVARRPEQVQALFTLARLRYFGLGRDPRPGLWAVRKELQVAVSRVERYASAPAPTSELGLDLRDSAALRAELQALMLRVEARLGADAESPGA